MTTTSVSARGANRRPPRPVVLLVPVPGRSTIHDLWAGTKLLVVFGVSVLRDVLSGVGDDRVGGGAGAGGGLDRTDSAWRAAVDSALAVGTSSRWAL